MAAVTSAFAPAKINLTLHVTGQRQDGYHLLDSLVAFADVGDVVRVHERVDAGLSLDVFGPKAQQVPTDCSNSVLQAAALMGQDGLAFDLEKNLPAQAGIGGGTSDAAAALRAVAELRGIDIPGGLEALGADVPVCAVARAARMSGIGEIVHPVLGFPRVWAVLVNPGVSVPTPKVFRALTSRNNAPMPKSLPNWQSVPALMSWLDAQRNDLQEAAVSVEPMIGLVLEALSAVTPRPPVRMSGSGATCFALFESAGIARSAARKLSQQHPDWWVVDCELS